MNELNIHTDLERIKLLAKHYSEKHNRKYTVIMMNPDEFGNFQDGSTYEFVIDSYFENERPHIKIICNTDQY